MKPLFDNIPLNDYFQPIKLLSQYYSSYNDYYTQLSKHTSLSQLNTIDLEEVILKYLECRPNAKLLIIFNSESDSKSDSDYKGDNKTTVHYKKSMVFDNKLEYENFMHQVKFIHIFNEFPYKLNVEYEKGMKVESIFYEGGENRS
jgi:hypothetical protein